MDKYKKVGTIGKGSFGQALLVRSVDGIQYVMKRIKVNASNRKSVRDEARLLAAMNHPNIIAYHEDFFTDSYLSIVMEYADGGDLQDFIDTRTARPVGKKLVKEEEILNIFVQICLAVKHVNDRKTLHRDIKSQNIFLTANKVVKLGDFGISKVLNHTLDFAATAIGTP